MKVRIFKFIVNSNENITEFNSRLQINWLRAFFQIKFLKSILSSPFSLLILLNLHFPFFFFTANHFFHSFCAKNPDFVFLQMKRCQFTIQFLNLTWECLTQLDLVIQQTKRAYQNQTI